MGSLKPLAHVFIIDAELYQLSFILVLYRLYIALNNLYMAYVSSWYDLQKKGVSKHAHAIQHFQYGSDTEVCKYLSDFYVVC